MRTHWIAPVVASMVLAGGCGSSDESEEPTAAAETTETAAPAPAADTASPIDGTWSTKPLRRRHLIATLRRHGLAEYIDEFKQAAPSADPPTRYVLELAEGKWDLYGEPVGGSREPLDYDSTFKVKGGTVTASHEGESNTYAWQIDGDTLTLAWRDTTYAPRGGLPEEVMQRALYQSAAFRRQG